MTMTSCRAFLFVFLFAACPPAIAQSRPPPVDAGDRPVRDASGSPLEYTTSAGALPAIGARSNPSENKPVNGSLKGNTPRNAARNAAASSPDYAEVWRTAALGAGIGSTGIWSADMDNDGDDDLVVSSNNVYWTIVSFDDASGEYEIAWQSVPYTLNWISALRVVEEQNTKRVWIGLGDGQVDVIDALTRERVATLTSGGEQIQDFALGDADNDGSTDVVVLTSSEVRLYDPLTLALVRSYPHGGMRAAVGNVDADSKSELVLNSGLVLELTGAEVTFDWTTDEFGARIELGDIDGDGMDELVGAASWYVLSAWDLDAKSLKWSLPADLDIDAMRLFDVTGDGVPEVLYGDGQWGEIYAVDATTQSVLWSVPNPEHGVTDVAVLDADDDGELELLWGAGYSSSGPDYLYVHDLGSGDLEWRSENTSGPYEATDFGDVDGDGEPEIVVASFDSESGYADGLVKVFDAATRVLEWQSEPNSFGGDAWTGIHDLVLVNADADPQLEIVVGTDRLYDGALYTFDGLNHALQNDAIYDDGSPMNVLDSADLTGDGVPEIVAGNTVAHTGSPGVYVYVLDALSDAVLWKSAILAYGFYEVSDIRALDVGGAGPDLVAAGGKLHAIRWSDKRHLSTTDNGYRSIAASDIEGSIELEILAGRDNGSIDVLDGETLDVGATYSVCPTPVVALEPLPSRRALVACGSELVVYDLAAGMRVAATESTVVGLGRKGSLVSGILGGRAVVLAGGSEAVVFADVSDNSIPVVDPLSTTVHWRGSAELQLSATDEDGDPTTFDMVSLPLLGTATWQDPADGTLRYVAAGSGTGIDNIAVRASDGYQYSAIESVTITLTNTAPAAGTTSVELHWRGTQTAAAIASDADGDPLSFALEVAPAHGTATIDASTGVLTYEPAGAYTGNDSLTYSVTDGADKTDQVVQILLANAAPAAADRDYNISPGTEVTSRFTATDADGDPLTYAVVNEPTQGKLTYEAETGLFEYIPVAGGSGTDSATFEVGDGVATAQATVRFRYPAAQPQSGGGGSGGGGGATGGLLLLVLALMVQARQMRADRTRASAAGSGAMERS